MNIKVNNINGRNIAELHSQNIEINNLQDALDLLGNASYLEAQQIIVNKSNICPEFFDLKTGIAGDILQKFSTYNMQLGIIGNFSNITSKSLRDFIYESNKMGRIVFAETFNEVIKLFK